MSRRPPSDAFTRFTSTSPHASQKAPISSPSSIHQGVTTPSDTETPAQKVARLRAANREAKARNSLSLVDRLVDRGRVWADITHRVTAYTLIGLTGVAACVSVYGLTSLIIHNRRQKRAWIDREMQRLRDAQTAFLQGQASAEQLHLLEQERAGEEMAARVVRDQEKRKATGVWSTVKGLVGRGTAIGEMGREDPAEAQATQVRRGGREKSIDEGWVQGEILPRTSESDVDAVSTHIKGVGLDSKGRPVPISRAVQEHAMRERARQEVESEGRRTGENEVIARTGVMGGPLDVLAGNIVGAVSTSGSGSWLSWVRGSRS